MEDDSDISIETTVLGPHSLNLNRYNSWVSLELYAGPVSRHDGTLHVAESNIIGGITPTAVEFARHRLACIHYTK